VPSVEAKQAVGQDTDIDMHLKSDAGSCVSVKSSEGSANSDHSIDLSKQITCEPFDCGSCSGQISGNEWWKCTVCDGLSMCLECWKNNKHYHHKKFLHRFYDYDPTGNIAYCDSCGVLFSEEDHPYVYNCVTCEDYALCEECKRQGMHGIHKKKIKKITIAKYKDILV
jgi:hypothetical protein